jgi:hypothetical protein
VSGGFHADRFDDFLDTRAHRMQPMNLVGTGWALTSALVGLFVLRHLAAFAWPTSGLIHGCVALVTTEAGNVARTFIEGVIGCSVGAWVVAALSVPISNRLAGR